MIFALTSLAPARKRDAQNNMEYLRKRNGRGKTQYYQPVILVPVFSLRATKYVVIFTSNLYLRLSHSFP